MTAELSKHERLIAEDRAKNNSPIGLAGPGSVVTFTCAGITASWHPPLAGHGVVIRWRGGPGVVFDLPAADVLSFCLDSMPAKIAGFAWVTPPDPEFLAAAYAATRPNGRDWAASESLPKLLERGKVPPEKGKAKRG